MDSVILIYRLPLFINQLKLVKWQVQAKLQLPFTQGRQRVCSVFYETLPKQIHRQMLKFQTTEKLQKATFLF